MPTLNGKPDDAIQDTESYQDSLDRLHHFEMIATIREGIASAESREMKPAEQVFTEMKAMYGLLG